MYRPHVGTGTCGVGSTMSAVDALTLALGCESVCLHVFTPLMAVLFY